MGWLANRLRRGITNRSYEQICREVGSCGTGSAVFAVAIARVSYPHAKYGSAEWDMLELMLAERAPAVDAATAAKITEAWVDYHQMPWHACVSLLYGCDDPTEIIKPPDEQTSQVQPRLPGQLASTTAQSIPDDRPQWIAPPSPPPKKPLPQIQCELELPKQSHSWGLTVVLSGILGLLIGWPVLVAVTNRAGNSPSSSTAPKIAPPSSPTPRFWSIGDTFADVLAIEGRPEASTGDDASGPIVWQYNLSDRVTFKQRTVIGWRNSTGKLKVTIGPRDSRPERQEGKNFRDRSTMQEVLAARGMPIEAWWKPSSDEQIWTYSNAQEFTGSYVSFQSGLVVGWARDLLPNGLSEKPERSAADKGPQIAQSLGRDSQSTKAGGSIDAPRPLPQWSAYSSNAIRGTVTMVSREDDGALYCAARFLRSVSGLKADRAAVFRLAAASREPEFVGEMTGLIANGFVVAGRCDGFYPENGDSVIVEWHQ